MPFKSINPFNLQVIKTYEFETDNQVISKIEASHNAYKKWCTTTILERSKAVKKIANNLRENRLLFAQTITEEMGKLIKESLAKVDKCAWLCDYYAEHCEQFLKDEVIEADGVKHFVSYSPLGVVLSIMPWNFPFWQALRFAIPTILAGNTTILKHSNNVPECSKQISDLVQNACGQGVMQSLYVTHNQIETVLSDRRIVGVSLTGSTEAGKKVAQVAGKYLKKVVLELGGSDPFIVCEDADLDKAIDHAMLGRFLNCGQSCIAAKRFIVSKKIEKQFIKKFVDKVKVLKMGDPNQAGTTLGPLVNIKASEELVQFIEDAKKHGALVEVGGEKLSSDSCFFKPTILSNVTKSMKVFREEVFGPIAPIISFNNIEEAIDLANDTVFGLGGSIWTNDLEIGQTIAKQIECGTVFVNSFVKSDPRIPFGGIKESGLGRELSHFGLKEFVNIKAYSIYK